MTNDVPAPPTDPPNTRDGSRLWWIHESHESFPWDIFEFQKGQKLKGPVVEDPAVPSLLDLQKGSKASRLEILKQMKQAIAGEGSSVAQNKYYDTSDTDSDTTLYSSSLDNLDKSANITDDVDEFDMDLSDDNFDRDDAATRYGVFMHNKSTATPNSTYLRPTVTSSSLDFIHTLLDETPTNKLTDFMSHPEYTDAQTTSVVHNLEGNPELTSYILGASEVSLGTHVDVLATKTLMHEMFPDENAYHLSSPLGIKMSYPKTNPQPNSLETKAKKLMQKLEALINFNNSEAFKKAVQEKVLTEIKKLLPTHIPNAITNYVRPRLNTFVLKVLKTNQINLFTQSSTTADDLLDIDLKTKQLNKIHSNKSNETYTTHQQLYNTLYESITLDPDALNAQATQLSFHKRSHDNQDPPNNHEGENKKKRRKDVTEPSSRSSRPSTLKVQYNNDVEFEYLVSQLKAAVLSEAQWNSDEGDVFKPKSFKRHMSKSTKPHPCFYNNDYSYLVDLSTEEKYTTSITKHYAARYYKEGIEDMIPEKWSNEVRCYHFEALNGIHHWEEDIIDFFKEGMSTVTKGNIYLELRIEIVVRIVTKKKWDYGFLTSIVVRRFDDKEYEFSYADLLRLSVNDVEDMYLLQVQDKLHYLPLEFVKDFNNALLMFIKRSMIKNRVKDIQLEVQSYQRTINLTKPIMFFKGVSQRIPFMMTATHKGVVYLNQYNIKSLMKLSEVKKFCDGTLVKIQENLIDMLTKNKLGSRNKWLKGRD
ncbi:hypothetical protein Tco_0528061 [Tanacetum coccineum]